MSRRVRAAIGVTLAASAFTGAACGAQDTAQLRARLIAANRASKELTAAFHAEREAAAARRPVPDDSVKAGQLTVRFIASELPPSVRATLDRAVRRAWAELEGTVGSAVLPVGGKPLVAAREKYSGDWLPGISISFQGSTARAYSSGFPLSERKAAAAILDLTGSVVAMGEPPALRSWTGNWMMAQRPAAEDWERDAISLATTDAAVTRECHAGAIERCKSALGLIPVSDSLREWYSPEDWRVMVGHWMPVADDKLRSAEIDACVRHDHSDACEQVARTRHVPIPLPIDSRRSLVAYALERGGPDAYARMMAAQGAPTEILSATAGVGVDSVVAGWRARVIASTPPAVQPGMLEMAAMLSWTVVFGAAASRRRP